jgi:hypothetical protein
MAPKKKTSKVNSLLVILAILLLIATLLKFDVVANVVDPNGKMKLQNIANDAFPLLLGTMLVILGIATIATVWVSIAFIAVGVIMVAQRGYQIYMRNKNNSITTG